MLHVHVYPLLIIGVFDEILNIVKLKLKQIAANVATTAEMIMRKELSETLTFTLVMPKPVRNKSKPLRNGDIIVVIIGTFSINQHIKHQCQRFSASTKSDL